MSDFQLNQPQREALINLLALGMYADGHLSLKEDHVIHDDLELFGWESGVGRTVFLDAALTRARRLDTDEKTVAYMQEAAAPFETAEAKQFALENLQKFLECDGLSESEKPFLAQVRKSLGI